MSFEVSTGDLVDEGELIDRKETAVRALFTLLLWLALRLALMVIGAVVVLELLVTFVTRQPPGVTLRRFANQALSYAYRVLRYATYNEEAPPFPFREFPAEVERSKAGDQRA
jgi:hypothetical protein